MPVAWYIVPYARRSHPIDQRPIRYPAIDDETKDIMPDGFWAESEVLGDQCIVKVRTTNAMLATLDGKYYRLPADYLSGSLASLSSQQGTELKGKLTTAGYTNTEIKAVLGNDLRQNTLGDYLQFFATRRLKPRLTEQNEVLVDGIEQGCVPISIVDSMVAED